LRRDTGEPSIYLALALHGPKTSTRPVIPGRPSWIPDLGMMQPLGLEPLENPPNVQNLVESQKTQNLVDAQNLQNPDH
jgi:hypothetical protein